LQRRSRNRHESIMLRCLSVHMTALEEQPQPYRPKNHVARP
jgi:hypothetical protein